MSPTHNEADFKQTSELVIARLLSHWTRPAEAGNVHELRRSSLATSAVLDVLLKEFSLVAIRSALETCLRETADTQWRGAATTRPQNFATDCCLLLAREAPSLALTPELVQELVYKVDSILGATALAPHVERHLDEAQLVDALTLGVRTAKVNDCRASCLNALGIYYRQVKSRSDTASLQRSLQAFEHEVRRFRGYDSEYFGAVRAARRAAWAVRRRRTELRQPSKHDFVAYRDEHDQALVYVVQRRDDAELAVAITRFELSERTLRISYECFDPALLPEFAPDVIEASVLQVYAQDTYLTFADEIEFFDTQHEQTHTRPVPLSHRLPT